MNHLVAQHPLILAPSHQDAAPSPQDAPSLTTDFGSLLGTKRIGFQQRFLLPGQNSSFPHAESHEEELVYVLAGAPSLWVDGHLYSLQAGDAAAFPAGTGIAHSVLNNSHQPASIISMGERTLPTNRCYFPLHPELLEHNPGFAWQPEATAALGPHPGLAKAGAPSCSDTQQQRPAFLAHYSRYLSNSSFSYPGDTETFGFGAPIGRKLGLERLAVWHEVLPAGKRTAWPHAHSQEEEFVYVISGQIEAWLDGERIPVQPGQAIAFLAGTGIAHCFHNVGKEDAHLLVLGEQEHQVPNDKLFYPEHPERNRECQAQGIFWQPELATPSNTAAKS